MSERLIYLLSGLAGGGLGAIFFGGLRWTVQRGLASGRPALWFFLGGFLRFSITLVGFYTVAEGHWQRLVACLFGFMIARFVVIRLNRPPKPHHAP